MMEVKKLDLKRSLIVRHDPIHPGEKHEHEYLPAYETGALDGRYRVEYGLVLCAEASEAHIVVVMKEGKRVIVQVMGFDDAAASITALSDVANSLADICEVNKRLQVFQIHIARRENAEPGPMDAILAGRTRGNA